MMTRLQEISIRSKTGYSQVSIYKAMDDVKTLLSLVEEMKQLVITFSDQTFINDILLNSIREKLLDPTPAEDVRGILDKEVK